MNLKNLNKEDILEALGIETRSAFWPAALAGFGAGCVVGAVIAIMVTPKSGRELRSDIRESGKNLLKRGKETVARVEEKANPPF